MLRSFRRAAVLCVLSVLLLPLVATTRAPQIARYVREHYTKHEFYVPMRDGTRLLTSVYVPKDTSRHYPIMLNRTPYGVGPYGAAAYPTSLGPSDLFTTDGFIFAYQDVRGRWMSGGAFVNARPICADKGGTSCIDESTDTYDTIEWLLKNVPNHNGRVGMWGISYPGFYVSAGMVAAHPSLKAVTPQAPVTEWFLGDDIHHNGAFCLALTFSFLNGFGRPRPEPTTKAPPSVVTYPSQDGYRFYLDIGPLANVNAGYFKNQIPFWTDLMAHPNYDAFWQSRDVRRHLTHITPAVMTVGGWFDNQDLFGALETYKAIEKNSAGADNRLIMGPWYHGGWAQSDGEGLGPVRFGAKTGKFYREQIEFPFFAHFLKDLPDPQLPRVYVFNTGRNEWRQFATWPPKTTSAWSLYLHANRRLSPEASAQDIRGTYDEYVSDPGRPVPFVDEVVRDITREYMVADQRFAAARPDVLVYQTDVLTQDVTVAGPIRPRLVVSTSGTDSDWVVKLIDVYPDTSPSAAPAPDSPATNASATMGGYQQLVRGEVMRGRFRSSYENPTPFVPNMPTQVDYAIPDVFHTFRRGHRIMIQIQSSWFPLFDRNPQTFVNINTATAADFHKATQRVYHAPGRRSKIEIAVLK